MNNAPFIKNSLRNFFGHTLLRKCLPQTCLLCAALKADSTLGLLCKGCAADLPKQTATACHQCAIPLGSNTPDDLCGHSLCGRCLRKSPHYDRTLSAYRYEFPLDKLVQALKYRAQLPLAAMFASVLGDLLEQTNIRPDAFIPLPLSTTRLAERGFNQAVEITRPLASRICIPMDTDSCFRTRDTTPQAELHWKERAANMRNAFGCNANFTGRHIAVIDDVMTTGATLDEFAKMLKANGAASVTNLVVARTP